ncbi:MAG: ABC-2 family transporter protein [Patescibacteria group bacterium]
MSRINYYFKIWLKLTKASFLSVLSQRLGFFIFFFGKIFRFGFLYLFIIFLLKGTKNLAGYSLDETLFFFLTFYFIDTFAQCLFREVYRFRPQVVSGSFDLILSKPFSALFKSLATGADVIDFAFLPVIVFSLITVGLRLHPSLGEAALWFVLATNGFLIATAFHIFVLGLGILTLEIDHTIMIYRDITSLGKFPIDIYKQPLKGILLFVLPVGVMFSIPAKGLIGILNVQTVIVSLLLGFVFMFLSLRFWKYSLKHYTSASS